MDETSVEKKPDELESAGPGLFALLSFLEALMNCGTEEGDGRIIVRPLKADCQQAKGLTDGNEVTRGTIRFIILNPGRYLHGKFIILILIWVR